MSEYKDLDGLAKEIDELFKVLSIVQDGVLRDMTLKMADDAVKLYESLGGVDRWNVGSEDLKLSIGKEIRRRRIAKGLHQHEIATMLGVGQSAFFKVEDGVYFPKIQNLKKICAILECSATDILGF